MIGALRYLSVIGLACLYSAGAFASPEEDAYIAGYAASILERDFKLERPAISVKNGVIKLEEEALKNTDRIKVMEALSRVPGVTGVGIGEHNGKSISSPLMHSAALDKESQQLNEDTAALKTGIFPDGHLFKSLFADPSWPHFSVAYHNYTSGDFDGTNIATVSFGETIPFYRQNMGILQRFNSQWEVGIQGGVVSDFNLDASSSDLVNTDFVGALYSSMRIGDFSAFSRVFHQSSHLGDEFLLRTRLERVNLSFEGIDLKLSYDLPVGFRLYGGGRGLFHKEPESLKVWSAQYGIEFRSPWRMDFGGMRPIAGADFKNFEENDWSTDISARAGVEFENMQVLGRKFQILAEYFNGYSPSGQFYNEKIEYIGLGAHFHF
jgi:hypothetical protein